MASALTYRLFGWDAARGGAAVSLSSSSDGGAETAATTGALLLSLASAIGAPVVFAFVNLVDKVAVDRRVRNTYAYTAVIGLFEMAIGATECVLSRWDNITRANRAVLAWPVVGGIMDGVSVYLYFVLIGCTDSSIVVGVQYMYPAVVCVLAYCVLGEQLALPGYAGVALLLAGAALLSTNGLARALHRCRPTAPLLAGLPELARAHPGDPSSSSVAVTDVRAKTRTADDADDDGTLVCWCPGGRGIPCSSCCSGVAGSGGSDNSRGHQRLPDIADDDEEDEEEDSENEDDPMQEGGEEEQEEEERKSRESEETKEEEEAEEGGAAILNAEEEEEMEMDEDGVPMKPLGTGVRTAAETAPRDRCARVPRSVAFVLLAVPMVLTVGGYEFLIAVAAKRGMRTLQVSGVEITVQGATLALGAVLTRGGRRGFAREAARNWAFALGNSVLTIASQLLTVFSLHALPAAVASSLCALQPLGILVLETVARVTAFRVSQCFAFKLPPIVLIVAGVALLSLDVLVHPAVPLSSSSSSTFL